MVKKVAKVSRKVRLYVWDKVLADYNYGMAVAAARSIEEARTAILTWVEKENKGWTSTLAGQLLVNEPKVSDIPAGVAIHGGS